MTERHALFVAWVLAVAAREGVPLRPDVDPVDGEISNRLALVLPFVPDVALWVVVPPPPDDWSPPWPEEMRGPS
jgi:hypothetical protein